LVERFHIFQERISKNIIKAKQIAFRNENTIRKEDDQEVWARFPELEFVTPTVLIPPAPMSADEKQKLLDLSPQEREQKEALAAKEEELRKIKVQKTTDYQIFLREEQKKEERLFKKHRQENLLLSAASCTTRTKALQRLHSVDLSKLKLLSDSCIVLLTCWLRCVAPQTVHSLSLPFLASATSREAVAVLLESEEGF
jgi:hypothetical protein